MWHKDTDARSLLSSICSIAIHEFVDDLESCAMQLFSAEITCYVYSATRMIVSSMSYYERNER